MHLPRDPGEWLSMAVLMAAFMAVAMIGMHQVRSHLGIRGHSMRPSMRPGLAMTAGSWLVSQAIALGIRVTIIGPMMLLTIPGRKSGRAYSLPVDIHEVAGRRYLIATHGIGSWVLNLRASGRGTLRFGRARTPFTARELSPEEAGPIIQAALGPLLATDGWRGRGLRNNLGVTEDAPPADYVVAALGHPVFEIAGETR